MERKKRSWSCAKVRVEVERRRGARVRSVRVDILGGDRGRWGWNALLNYVGCRGSSDIIDDQRRCRIFVCRCGWCLISLGTGLATYAPYNNS